MKEFFGLLKKGNKSAIIAAVVNAVIGCAKGVAFILTANVAMFAEMLHSFGDAANQLFVFVGSALSKKKPTDRFPNGFGRLVNLVLLGAVIVVAIMSYEAIKEGLHSIFHPTQTEGFIINIAVLSIGVLLESVVLWKAMNEVIRETGGTQKGLAVIPASFKNLSKAKPATKLVVLEDSVATSGGLLALLAVVISHYTSFHQAEGIASILIGGMMFFVVGKVFLDNAAGVIGEADEEMEIEIGNLVLTDANIKDVREVVVIKEGEDLHVDMELEVLPQMTILRANEIKDEIEQKILDKFPSVKDVDIQMDIDDGKSTWEVEVSKNNNQNNEQ